MIGSNFSESDYESGVLSACLRDYGWPSAYSRACELISPKHFADANKGKVFEAMGELTEPPDEVVLSEKTGIEIIDLMDWCGRTETSTYVTTFAEGVIKCWARRQAQFIALEVIDKVKENEEPNEILSNASKRITDALGSQSDEIKEVHDGIDDTLQRCYDLDDGKIEPGINTGLTDLDKVLGGFKVGEFATIAARPSHGKTALALSIAANIASQGKRVMFCSLEMTTEQLKKRLIHAEARVPIINQPNHYHSEDREKLREAVERIKGWHLKVDQTCGVTVPYLLSKAMAEKARYGLDILFIDYIGIMNGPGKDIYERVSGISRGIQQIAKKVEIPVVALSQQNRESEKDSSAKMSHLRDSGSVEQDADQVIMLRRSKEMGEKPFQPIETMEVTIAKNRNGCTGRIPLTFSRSFARYDSTAKQNNEPRLN
tara:strand:- start:152 stop:1441 length:1290 start_codon:yes stop_codon:yes gene_type:complete